MGIKETCYDKENFQGLFWSWKRKSLLYFLYQCLSKGRAFWSQQKEIPHYRKGNSVPKKQMHVTGRCCCRTSWKKKKKKLRLSYCLTTKLVQAFHCSLFLLSCWLPFHDSFGQQHPALWCISRAPGSGRADTAAWWPAHGKQSHTVASVAPLDAQLPSLLAKRVVAPHSFPEGFLWPVLRNLLWFSELQCSIKPSKFHTVSGFTANLLGSSLSAGKHFMTLISHMVASLFYLLKSALDFIIYSPFIFSSWLSYLLEDIPAIYIGSSSFPFLQTTGKLWAMIIIIMGMYHI